MKYRTNQSCKLNTFFENHKDRLFSIEDALSSLEGVGKSTIYRQFANAEQKGIIKKVGNELYQYVDKEEGCSEHLHFVCKECGNFIHLDHEKSESLIKEFEEQVGFKLAQDTTFFGKCKNCKEKQC